MKAVKNVTEQHIEELKNESSEADQDTYELINQVEDALEAAEVAMTEEASADLIN